jgi:hypothetical protein
MKHKCERLVLAGGGNWERKWPTKGGEPQRPDCVQNEWKNNQNVRSNKCGMGGKVLGVDRTEKESNLSWLVVGTSSVGPAVPSVTGSALITMPAIVWPPFTPSWTQLGCCAAARQQFQEGR